MSREDIERLRFEDDDTRGQISRYQDPSDSGVRFAVGITTTITTYPTTITAYYGVTLQGVLGAETEGGSPSLTALTATILALNIGNAIPASGTTVLCSRVRNRWVFRYDG